MPLVFCDESDTVRVLRQDVFVYICLRLDYHIYKNLETDFLALKSNNRMSQRNEVKWTKDQLLRQPCLDLLSKHQVEIFYYVVINKRECSRAERYRRKTLQTAFRSLCGWSGPIPLIVLDTRSVKQDHDEANILKFLMKFEGLSVPAYAFLPSNLVVGLQLADMVAGAVRAYEGDGEEKYYSIIRRLVKERVEVRGK
jgi:hypothetical protein